MIFGNKLTWKKHIDKLITKCQKDLNIFRAVSGTSFWADKLTLRNLYVALILSKIEYGLLAYAPASNTQISRLDAIQNAAMPIILSHFRSINPRSELAKTIDKLEDLKVLRRSPDLLNNVKIGQGQLQLIMEQILFYQMWGLQTFWLSDLNNLMNNSSNSPVFSEKQMFR